MGFLSSLASFLNPYFTNIWWIVFSVSLLTLLLLWWAFHTIKQIHVQREFAVYSLQSIAKLWKKVKYIPEDAKDRESLYLYKDFLSRLDDTDSKFPIVVKNGGVRVMSRVEYDRLCGQNEKRSVSILISVLSVLYAIVVLIANYKSIQTGIIVALVLPIMQIILAIFISRFKKEKNDYRTKLFLELKDYGVDFFSITKPFIVVDSYPEKFGKKTEPKFVGLGEITQEQIEKNKEFIMRQRAAETRIVVEPVKQVEAEPEQIMDDTQISDDTDINIDINELNETPIAQDDKPEQPSKQDEEPMSTQEKKEILAKLALSGLFKDLKEKESQPVPEPDAEDFSLDSIGIALDAEISKRRKIS